MKTCTKCGVEKPLSEYYKEHNNARIDALQTICKKCRNKKYFKLDEIPPYFKEFKTCTKCGETKHMSEFPIDRTKSHGYCAQCKKCRYAHRAKLDKKYNEKRKEKAKKDPLFHRKKHYWQRYKLTIDDYNEITKNGCEICGTTENLIVDHNHKTNEIRGCLCRSCNRGIGYLGDNLEYVLNAALYLERKGTYNSR